MFLIVGLGNPGKSYQGTRHNIGFSLLDLLAKKFLVQFRKSSRLQGDVAEVEMEGKKCLLLKPQTYMNLSGNSVLEAVKYQPIDLTSLLVVVDDVALPLGEIRLRAKGGSGGHNGLVSIEERLQTQDYPRLRLGVGDRLEGDLASHVLGKFSKEEESAVSDLLERAEKAVEMFVKDGLTRAMDFVNRSPQKDRTKPSTPCIGQEDEK